MVSRTLWHTRAVIYIPAIVSVSMIFTFRPNFKNASRKMLSPIFDKALEGGMWYITSYYNFTFKILVFKDDN